MAYDSQNIYPQYLKKIAPVFRFHKQKGSDLGQRMYNAFRFASKNGASRIIIIGSDSPTLPKVFIEEGFDALDRNDVVLGPSCDGGYYLIGLRWLSVEIFRAVEWGSSNVFEQTVNNLRRLNRRFLVLKDWYDIDGPQALFRLKDELSKNKKGPARWTKRFLRAFSLPPTCSFRRRAK
jgi:rSAM/selenodomain-associated transferase 1